MIDPIEQLGSYSRLQAILLPLGRIAVALSGGVDSAVLAAAAARILGPANVLTITVEAPMIPAADRADAETAAVLAGVRHLVLTMPEQVLDQQPFVSNPPDRCYHCKRLIFTAIRAAAGGQGFATLCDGTNADDLHEDRPGLRALQEMNVSSPLAEAGLTKADVRRLAACLCPDFAAKPAMACLATRIPTGTPVTLAAMQRIDRAEAALRAAGLLQVRVRDHGGLARIELATERLAAGLSADMIGRLQTILHAAGFQYVTLDLDGYRTGSMQGRTSDVPGQS